MKLSTHSPSYVENDFHRLPKFMFRIRFIAVSVLLVMFAIGGASRAVGQLDFGFNEPKEVDAAAIRKAIERGKDFLLKQQNADGTWSGNVQQPGGITALCTLALLNSGVPPKNPQIEKALAALRKIKPEKVYASSLIIMVFCTVDPKRDANLIGDHARFLVRTQDHGATNQAYRGGWAYGDSPTRPDNSNSQFALLGLYEAERAEIGLKFDQRIWRDAIEYWKTGQSAAGSWGYTNRDGAYGTGSMTSAGVSSLIICRSKINDGDAALDNDALQCCRSDNVDDDIERGLAWIGKMFTVQNNPANPPQAGGDWQLYYLYGIERIGRLSGRRFFYNPRGQGYDWYRMGAQELIDGGNKQDPISGEWSSPNFAEKDPPVATSLALLFLSKGRRPVVIGKAKWGNDRDQSWNRHRQDVANLTSFVETAWKKDFPIGLSWQVVDLEKNPTVEDLLQTPVLFISGSNALDWAADPVRIKLLRDYIDRGGFIFAEACCPSEPGSADFDRDFRKVVQAIFADKPEHQLKLLDQTHPIWRAERPVPPEAVRRVEGVDYGCRTSLIYVPPTKRGTEEGRGNLGCWWELNAFKDRTMGDKARRELLGAHYLGLNVLAYATNRELKGKDETLNLKAENKKPDTSNRALVYLAKLKHPGECDTAPGALPGILRAAEKQLGFRAAIEPRLIEITGDAIFDYHMVFMHGRSAFTLTPAEEKQLRTYVERGGTIFCDAICSNKAFADSFRAEMKKIFPNEPLETIPQNHALMTDKYGGFDLSRVVRRRPREADGALDAAKQVGPPELEGVKVGDRYGVIFSKYDLSCALERHDSLECEGYSRDDAERISLNVLLYSLNQ